MQPRHLRARLCPPSAILALCAAIAVALAACAGANSARVVATPGTPAAKVVARAGDLGLCTLVSPSEFAHITGRTSNQVTPGVTADSLTGLQEVYCLYLDNTDPQQLIARGTINYEVAGDPHTANRIFQRVKQTFVGVVDVRGIGDAAFTGTPGGLGDGAGTGLLLVSGPVLLYLSVGGDPATVTRITRQLAAVVLSRVA